MKRTFILLALTALTITTISCRKERWPYCERAKGDIATETRYPGNFDRIDMDLSGDILLFQNADLTEPVVTIETNENIMDRIETDVTSGTLVIKEDRCIRKLERLDITIKVPDLEAVTLNGSGSITTAHRFTLDEIAIDINGSGDVNFETDATSMDISIDGSGDMDLDGTTDELFIDINGSGDIHAFGLRTTDCYININGSGDCEVDVYGVLDVDISGSGDVTYSGTPTSFIANNNGSGSVNPR